MTAPWLAGAAGSAAGSLAQGWRTLRRCINAALWAASSAHAARDLARAEEIVQGKCFICHGMAGESSSPVFPRLAGQNAA